MPGDIRAMDARRRIILWTYVTFLIVYMLTLFTDDTLRVPYGALHGFRKWGLVPILMFCIFFLLPRLRRDAEASQQATGFSPILLTGLVFGAIGSAAAAELATGATTASALTTPSPVWVLPLLVLAIAMRKLWLRYCR